MPIFAVSRRNDPAGPLLLASADDVDEAVAYAEEHEKIGTFTELGYIDSPDGYTAVPADDEQKAQCRRSVEAAIEEGIDPDTDDPEWLTFIRPPDFDPPIEYDPGEEDDLDEE
jgi:hypothetical protein